RNHAGHAADGTRDAVRLGFGDLARELHHTIANLDVHCTGMLDQVPEAGADALVQAGVVDWMGGEPGAGFSHHALQAAGGVLALAADIAVGVAARCRGTVARLGAAAPPGGRIEEVHGSRARGERRGESDEPVHRFLRVGWERSLPPPAGKPCEEHSPRAACVQLASATSTPSRPWLSVRASPPWASLMRRRTSLAESA